MESHLGKGGSEDMRSVSHGKVVTNTLIRSSGRVFSSGEVPSTRYCKFIWTKGKQTTLLMSPISYCSLYNRSINRDMLLGQGIMTLFGKWAEWEDGGLMSQRTIFPKLEFRLPLYYLKEEVVKSWFWPDSGGDVLIPSFLQPFTGRLGQVVSSELNKGISVNAHYLGGRVTRDGPLCII